MIIPYISNAEIEERVVLILRQCLCGRISVGFPRGFTAKAAGRIHLFLCVNSVVYDDARSDFLMPMLLISDSKKVPIPTTLYVLKSSNVRHNVYMIAMTLSCLPPMIAFVFFNKMIMGGINIGRVKG